jgi:hypothetical protein
MCTVTFIPAESGVFITASRDEKTGRSRATPPGYRNKSTGRLLCPGDPDGGGTWVALHELGHAVVFLNGGFVPHISEPPYRRSRGLVLLDLAENPSPSKAFAECDLQGIEPFTAVAWDGGALHECRWDGSNRHARRMDEAIPHIWSSATLYDPTVMRKRERWFSEWLSAHPSPGPDAILDFHLAAGDGDACNDVLMEREGDVCTVSVTSMEIRPKAGLMRYLDLREPSRHIATIPFRSLTPQTR